MATNTRDTEGYNAFQPVTSAIGLPTGAFQKPDVALNPPPLDLKQLAGQYNNKRILGTAIARLLLEVGNQGDDAYQAFSESFRNRAFARHKGDLMKVLVDQDKRPGHHYYTGNQANPGWVDPDSKNPQVKRAKAALYKALVEGSDIAHGSTGNSSGKVRFGGGPKKAEFGKENFGVELADLKWWNTHYAASVANGNVAQIPTSPTVTQPKVTKNTSPEAQKVQVASIKPSVHHRQSYHAVVKKNRHVIAPPQSDQGGFFSWIFRGHEAAPKSPGMHSHPVKHDMHPSKPHRGNYRSRLAENANFDVPTSGLIHNTVGRKFHPKKHAAPPQPGQ